MAKKGAVLSKKAEAKGQELYAKSLQLSTAFDDNFMELARNVRSLQETDSERFKDLIDKSGLGRRKAYYLIALDKALGNIKISKQRLRKIGWTKMALMAPVVTKYNFAELLEFAENHTAKEIQVKVSGGKHENNAHSVLFYFNEQNYEELQEALIKFGAKRHGRGLVNKDEALMKLVEAVGKSPKPKKAKEPAED